MHEQGFSNVQALNADLTRQIKLFDPSLGNIMTSSAHIKQQLPVLPMEPHILVLLTLVNSPFSNLGLRDSR